MTKVMHAGFRLSLLFLAGLCMANPVLAQETPEAFFCEDADPGFVQEIPSPFSGWVQILCTHEGQVMAAAVDGDPAFWVIHGTVNSVMVQALPPWLNNREDLVARYGPEVRFDYVFGRQLGSEFDENKNGLFGTAYPDLPAGSFAEVWQLDIRSIYNATMYSLFFFTDGKRPQHMIWCAMECNLSLPLDVLTFDEVDARLAQ